MNDFVFRDVVKTTLLICEPLERAGFTHAFTTRLGGVSPLPEAALSLGNFNQDSAHNIRENRRRLLDALNISDWPLVTAKQIHSADVTLINEAQTEPTTCDALTTDLPRTLLAIQAADCMPILLGDQRTRAVAAVHAGWRGTLASIVARTIERMQHAYGTQTSDVIAAFGPTIQAPNFEVGPEVIAQFETAYGFAPQAISQRKPTGQAHLDLAFINRRLLENAGVPAKQIYDCGFCTVERNDLFFSYRKERGAEQPVGRMMGVIGRNE
jgi:YfiH family protein